MRHLRRFRSAGCRFHIGRTFVAAALASAVAASVGAQIPLGPVFQVNEHTTGEQHSPTVVATGDGGFAVVWQSSGQDGDGQGIAGRRFDREGTPVGEEFIVNDDTVRDQVSPHAAAAPDGSFIVAWTGPGFDPNEIDPFAKIFATTRHRSGRSSGLPLRFPSARATSPPAETGSSTSSGSAWIRTSRRRAVSSASACRPTANDSGGNRASVRRRRRSLLASRGGTRFGKASHDMGRQPAQDIFR